MSVELAPNPKFDTEVSPDNLDLDTLNAEFADLTPRQRIEKSLDIFGGNLVLATTFGPTAPVLLKEATDVQSDIPVINIRHGHETQSTVEHAGFYWANLGLNLHVYRGIKLEIPDEDSPEFLEFQRRSKVEPFQQALAEHSAQAYLSGAMSWQTEERKQWSFVERRGDLVAVNPLLDMTKEQVDRFFETTGLPKNENYHDPTKGADQKSECQLNTADYDASNNQVDLTSFQADVLSLISVGQTVKQISRQLDAPEADIKRVKKTVPRKFGVKNLAAGVAAALEQRQISLEVRPDKDLTDGLSALDLGALEIYKSGGSIKELAKMAVTEIKPTTNYEAELLRKIKAWSRPHAVRRAYELGIFTASTTVR